MTKRYLLSSELPLLLSYGQKCGPSDATAHRPAIPWLYCILYSYCVYHGARCIKCTRRWDVSYHPDALSPNTLYDAPTRVQCISNNARSRDRTAGCAPVEPWHTPPWQECLHSALKMIAVWILNVLMPRPATREKQKQWANTAAWCIFVSAEKSIDAAHCLETS